MIVKVRSDVRDRILYVYDLLRTRTEGLTVKEMIDEIYADFGIRVDRKAIYQDIAAISLYLPIIKERRGKQVYFRRMQKEDFE